MAVDGSASAAGGAADGAVRPPRHRSPRQIEESAQNRSAIVASAMEVFANNGYAKTTLDAVADRVGLTRQGVLHHFGSKEGLFREVLEESGRWAARQSEASRGVAGLPAVRALSHFVGNGSDVHIKLAHTLHAEAMQDGAPAHVVHYARNRSEQIRRHIDERLAEAQRDGMVRADLDVATVASVLTSAITGLQAQSLIGAAVEPEPAFELLVRLITENPPDRLASATAVRADGRKS